MYLVGNWKMTGEGAFAGELASEIANAATACGVLSNHKVICCPPSIWIKDVIAALGDSGVLCGAQDAHEKEKGAYTGNISAGMIKSVGCDYAIIGHSERREYHAETDNLIAQKVSACLSAEVTPILCVGETQEERDANKYKEIIAQQIDTVITENDDVSQEVIVAYEPVWAIGTGRVPTAQDIDEVCSFIHKRYVDAGFKSVSVLYGGSVKPANCAEIFGIESVNGVLVGGASVDARQWTDIMQAATTHK